MLHRIESLNFEAGSDAHELGLMAAICPEFAEQMVRSLAALGDPPARTTADAVAGDAVAADCQLSSR